jgi:hypothetical protein
MKVATQVTKIKAAISKGLATQHPVKLVAGLGLGAVLMAGTALHFVPNSNNESGSAFSSDQQRAAERREEAQNIISWLLNHSKPASPSYEEQRAADSLQERLDIQQAQKDMYNYHRGVSRPSYEEPRAAERHDVAIERLERQIDRLLTDAAQDPSRNTPSLNREIERLDKEIDMLRLNAMQN